MKMKLKKKVKRTLIIIVILLILIAGGVGALIYFKTPKKKEVPEVKIVNEVEDGILELLEPVTYTLTASAPDDWGTADKYYTVTKDASGNITASLSNVTINKTFYDHTKTQEEQENAIIFYENTYMQNSGVDYKSTESFEVVSILDGTVVEVTENEILGTTIKIRHQNDLISTYQSLSEVNVTIDTYVVRGQIIAMSGTSKLFSSDSNLHFELTYQGKNINPEQYYNKSTDEL